MFITTVLQSIYHARLVILFLIGFIAFIIFADFIVRIFVDRTKLKRDIKKLLSFRINFKSKKFLIKMVSSILIVVILIWYYYPRDIDVIMSEEDRAQIKKIQIYYYLDSIIDIEFDDQKDIDRIMGMLEDYQYIRSAKTSKGVYSSGELIEMWIYHNNRFDRISLYYTGFIKKNDQGYNVSGENKERIFNAVRKIIEDN